ncbi:MAG: hypothetical protein ABIQ16_00910 [Polyangiaceae bacterium]
MSVANGDPKEQLHQPSVEQLMAARTGEIFKAGLRVGVIAVVLVGAPFLWEVCAATL